MFRVTLEDFSETSLCPRLHRGCLGDNYVVKSLEVGYNVTDCVVVARGVVHFRYSRIGCCQVVIHFYQAAVDDPLGLGRYHGVCPMHLALSGSCQKHLHGTCTSTDRQMPAF